MQLDIQARSFSLIKALRDYLERDLWFVLGTRDEHVQRVMVRLSDVNDPQLQHTGRRRAGLRTLY